MSKKPPVYERQRPPSELLQGSSVVPSPFNDSLLRKAMERVDETLELLRRIHTGNRPALDSGEGRGRKWVRAQIEMEAGRGYLPEHPTAYYKLTEKEPLIGYNPAPHLLIERAAHIEKALLKEQVRPRVLGTKRHLSIQQLKPLQRISDVLIALPGDIKTDLELTEIIKRKLEGASLPPLIIENHDHSHDALLANFQLMEFNQYAMNPNNRRTFLNADGLADHFGIYLTGSHEETIQLAVTLTNKRQAQASHIPMETVSFPNFIPEGATVFVATATRKKYKELSAIHSRQGLRINILPIDILVDSYLSPKEESGSYEGNAAEKIHAAFNAWERMKPATQVRRLTEIGKRLHRIGRRKEDTPLEMEEIFLISEDSGFHFVQMNPQNRFNLSTEMEFADIAHKIDPRVPFPGVETGPGILGNNGVTNFFANVGKILDRYREFGYPSTREVINKSIIALAQLQPNPGTYDAHIKDKAKKIVMYMAESREIFQTFPQPATGSLEIGNFLLPLGYTRTEAELGEAWSVEESPRAMAWKALIADQSIPCDPSNYAPPISEKDYHVAIIRDNEATAIHEEVMKLAALNQMPEFHIAAIDAQIYRLSDVQSNMLEGYDAMVLAFDPASYVASFWRNLWIYASMIVAEQTRDKYKLEKPLYLVNPKNDQQHGAFDYLEKLTQHLHVVGTIAQDPETLYHSVGTIGEAVSRIMHERNDYLRYEPPEYAKGPAIEPIGEESAKGFNVVIFVSASNENESILEIGKHLAIKLSALGFGVYSGAGLYSGMGAITRALMEIKDESDTHHTGFNVPHIMDGGEVRGKNIVDLVDRFHLCRDIYERIEGLLGADAAIVAPGGMGTLQELAGFALLKEMTLNDPKHPYHELFKTSELVIINSPIELAGRKCGFYDLLIEVIPEQDYARLGMHVVEDSEQAIAKMEELRRGKNDG